LVGASHGDDYSIWDYGHVASEGVKEICEFGYSNKLETNMKRNVSDCFFYHPHCHLNIATTVSLLRPTKGNSRERLFLQQVIVPSAEGWWFNPQSGQLSHVASLK